MGKEGEGQGPVFTVTYVFLLLFSCFVIPLIIAVLLLRWQWRSCVPYPPEKTTSSCQYLYRSLSSVRAARKRPKSDFLKTHSSGIRLLLFGSSLSISAAFFLHGIAPVAFIKRVVVNTSQEVVDFFLRPRG